MSISIPHQRISHRITERDLEIIGEVLRWGQLTTRQIARWFFESPRTGTNRLSVLISIGYLRTIPIPWQAPAILTATPKAARARADLGLPPKAHAPGRLLHDLTVVEIAAWLLDQDQQATWLTEREILRDQLRQARDLDGRLRRGPSRRPDGILIRSNGQREAVELELTPKRDRTEYDRKFRWYVGEFGYAKVHWFARSHALRNRLLRLAHQYDLVEFMRVSPLPPSQEYLPGIKADSRIGNSHHRAREEPTTRIHSTVRIQP